MDEVLANLLGVSGVLGAMVVTKDGLSVTSAGQIDPDPDSLGVTAADLLRVLEGSLESLAPLQMVTLEGATGILSACAINEVTYLLVQGGENLNFGRLRLELRNGARSLVDQL